MMGQQTSDQRQLFYAFDLEMVVPGDHLLRGIDAVLGLISVFSRRSKCSRISFANISAVATFAQT